MTIIGWILIGGGTAVLAAVVIAFIVMDSLQLIKLDIDDPFDYI